MANGKERVVVALGGNAFVRPGGGLSMADQFDFARRALRVLLPLFTDDREVLLSHGNGPQVGYMLIRVEHALGNAYNLPLEVCVAESEGELGYVLQQSLHNVLLEVGRRRPVVSVLTQVVVDPEDPAFDDPIKPIGPFLDEDRAAVLAQEGFVLVEDSGRGFRRAVASPKPLRIVELGVLESLLSDGVVVVAGGGGGIPVVEREGALQGVEAVVDKDLSSALLADQLGAQRLVILTGVPCVYVDFSGPNRRPLGEVSVAEAQQLFDAGEFARGSMGPKVEAAMSFASKPGREAIICDPETLEAALRGEGGTRVVSRGKA